MGWGSINLVMTSWWVRVRLDSLRITLRYKANVKCHPVCFSVGHHSAVQQSCKQCKTSGLASNRGGRGPVPGSGSRRVSFLPRGQRAASQRWVSSVSVSLSLCVIPKFKIHCRPFIQTQQKYQILVSFSYLFLVTCNLPICSQTPCRRFAWACQTCRGRPTTGRHCWE